MLLVIIYSAFCLLPVRGGMEKRKDMAKLLGKLSSFTSGPPLPFHFLSVLKTEIKTSKTLNGSTAGTTHLKLGCACFASPDSLVEGWCHLGSMLNTCRATLKASHRPGQPSRNRVHSSPNLCNVLYSRSFPKATGSSHTPETHTCLDRLRPG